MIRKRLNEKIYLISFQGKGCNRIIQMNTDGLSVIDCSPWLFLRSTQINSWQCQLKIIFDEWGNKRLAYEIKKKTRGFYIRIDYCGTGTLVDEMERLLRIDDRVLKYLTVLLKKNVDLESIKEEIKNNIRYNLYDDNLILL